VSIEGRDSGDSGLLDRRGTARRGRRKNGLVGRERKREEGRKSTNLSRALQELVADDARVLDAEVGGIAHAFLGVFGANEGSASLDEGGEGGVLKAGVGGKSRVVLLDADDNRVEEEKAHLRKCGERGSKSDPARNDQTLRERNAPNAQSLRWCTQQNA
jgi:hypothetical protein